tara:strand:- start:2681 stop:3259 length:579 start_codon:yes stop_codon:yes gene_type:complete
MNLIKRVIGIILACLVTTGFANSFFFKKQETITVSTRPVEIPVVKIEVEPLKINQQEMFLNAIGMRESSNRYDVVNKWGYMGKYQFGKKTLRNLGYKVSKKEFLNNPQLQEQAMLDLLSHNKKILKNYIIYWDGKIINGETITESGILAAAHLAGPGNVKRYFKRGKDFSDGNGTKLTKYLTQFSGYELNIE